jgi:hypothetical protein
MRISRLQDVINWLSVEDNTQEKEYERMIRSRHDGTCEWIHEVPELKAWLKDDTRNQLLWLSGKPGAGKL